MSPNPYVRRWCNTVFFLSFITGMALAAAIGAAAKNPKKGSGISPDQMVPTVLNAGTNPTLRYPVFRFTGAYIKSTSYGWFDVTRSGVRYVVVQPETKASDGFDIPAREISGLALTSEVRGYLYQCPVLQFHRSGGEAKGRYVFFYVPPERWGKIGHDFLKTSRAGQPGTESMIMAIRSFDDTLATFLVDPIRKGDLAKVEALLKNNPDLALNRDNLGMTPLHWAAAGGRREVVELLLANQAEVNARDDAGETPLHKAARRGHKDVTELLLAKQADVNAQNKRGETPLHLVAENHYPDVAELLRQHGGQDVTSLETTLQDAAGAGDLAKVQALLKDHPALAASKNYKGETPLHFAATGGYREVAELLLANKAEVNAKDIQGDTPLHWAAAAGRKDVVDLLLTSQAEVNAKDNSGATPLHVAATKGQIDMTWLLREHGGEPLSDFSGSRSLDPALLGMSDKIVLLPVVDARSNKNEEVDLENVRKEVQKALEGNHYVVMEADSPPPAERWVMAITLTEFGPGRLPNVSVFGSLYDKQSDAVCWQARADGRYHSANELQPGQKYPGAEMQMAGQWTDLTLMMLGKAKKWAVTDAVGNLLRGIPKLSTQKKK